jgi:hypothetical protein
MIIVRIIIYIKGIVEVETLFTKLMHNIKHCKEKQNIIRRHTTKHSLKKKHIIVN